MIQIVVLTSSLVQLNDELIMKNDFLNRDRACPVAVVKKGQMPTIEAARVNLKSGSIAEFLPAKNK